jgi:SAM-dependent methyltransferase
LKRSLENIDSNLFKRLREHIREGKYTGAAFTPMIYQYTGYAVGDGKPDKIGYDNLDVFINALLDDHPVPEETNEREPEMVFYQKTPARLVFQLAAVAQLKPGDIFYDIGSGLGQVTILMHLISGAECRGVEYEPAYHAYAQACAAQLNLTHVQFINADARQADFSDGTVFFLYTPFMGVLLQQVLDLLQQQAQKRPIRLFTYGPCSTLMARQSWLYCVSGNADDDYNLCTFSSRQ